MQRSLATLMTTTLITWLALGQGAKADFARSHCAYVPNGHAKPTISMPCLFSQRQGIIGIAWDDGVHSRYIPIEGKLGTYLDQRGGLVYRQSGRNGADLVFKMEAGNVFIYWGR